MVALAALTALLAGAPGVLPSNDTSCHTGQGHIVGVKFCGKEIKTVPDVSSFGLCCEACGVQASASPPPAQVCRWIMYDSATKECVLNTGQGSLCGQKNSITNSAHGPEKPQPAQQYACQAASGTCTATNSSTGGGTTYNSSASCKAGCKAPPPPLSAGPCIRFGHALPVSQHVDATIVQDDGPTAGTNHTWTDLEFGDFSDWVSVFRNGKGTLTIWENKGGKRVEPPVLQVPGIPLTPGPLVVVIKVGSATAAGGNNATTFWPPHTAQNVETIAASYVESAKSPKARLFNLSPDTQAAGMACSANGTAEIVSNVRYSLGSNWKVVSGSASTFSVVDDTNKKKLCTRRTTPPSAPLGFTLMLLGLQKPGTPTQFVINAKVLRDAPEGGRCSPGHE